MAEHATEDERAKEYGQYVAIAPIDVGGHRAFNPGDSVPASTVKDNPSWTKPDAGDVQLVARAGTKAAQESTDA